MNLKNIISKKQVSGIFILIFIILITFAAQSISKSTLDNNIEQEGENQEKYNVDDIQLMNDLREFQNEYASPMASGNAPPFLPDNPSPSDKEIISSMNPQISIHVFDPDDDYIRVIFFNAFDNKEIGRINNISSNSRASIKWNNLLDNKEYQWYVNVSDGITTMKSEIYTFFINKDISSYHLENEYIWGGDNDVRAEGLCLDPYGNIYQVGTINEGPSGNDDIIIVKFDPLGNVLWNKTWGSDNYDLGSDIYCDSCGNVYIVGTYYFYPGLSQHQICLIKIDGEGNELWVQTHDIGTLGSGLSINTNNEIYVGGFSTINSNIILIKYDYRGNVIWERWWNGTEEEATFNHCVALDLSENIYIGGSTKSKGKGGYDAILIKYNAYGQEIWNRSWGGINDDYIYSLTVDEDQIFIIGKTESFLINQKETQFLVKFNAEGVQSWNRTWSGFNGAISRDVSTDLQGNIYLTGYKFDSSMNEFAYILTYDKYGNIIWETEWGSTSDAAGYGIIIDSLGDILISGKVSSYEPYINDLILLRYRKDLTFNIDADSLTNNLILDSLSNTLSSYERLGYYPTYHPSSLHATYYALYILQSLNKLDQINRSKVLNYIMSHYNASKGTFSDLYSHRYLDVDLDKDKPPPLTSLLEINCYATLSLSLMGELNQIDSQKMIDFLWSCLHPIDGGFLGISWTPELTGELSLPTADNTFYAIKTLNFLITDWSDYTQEIANITQYLINLQCSSVGIHLGGFYNEQDLSYKSLVIDETNLLASYFCIKTLDLLDALNEININDFHSYLNYLYNSEEYYFTIAPHSKYFMTDYSNIIATALGLDLALLTGFSVINSNEVLNYLINNRNDIGNWDKSTEINYHELIYTFQIVRSINEAGMINTLNSTIKDLLYNSTRLYESFQGYSLMSFDHISQERLNALVDIFYKINHLNSLDKSYIFTEITRSFQDYSEYNIYQFYSYTTIDNAEKYYHTHPFEFETTGNHKHVNEFNAPINQRSLFQALETLYMLDLLDDFEIQVGIDMNNFLDSILSCQFLEQGHPQMGGFSPDGFHSYLNSNLRAKYIYPEHSFYAIKSLDLLAEYLNMGGVSDLSFNKSDLASYILSHKIESTSEIYFAPPYSNDPLEILQTTYQCIYILTKIYQYSLDSQKIKNYIESQLSIDNIENLYYCYAINKILNLEISFDEDGVKRLLHETYSELIHEFCINPNKESMRYDYLNWIIEMGNNFPYKFVLNSSFNATLGNFNLVTIQYNNLIYDMCMEDVSIKFESEKISNSVLHESNDGVFYNYVYIPWNLENYPNIEGYFRAYDRSGTLLAEQAALIITKSNSPKIEIFFPYIDSFHGQNAPEFDVKIIGYDVHKKWYLFNEEENKYFFTNESQFDNTAWNQIADGIVNISFFANNSLGDCGREYFSIIKDTVYPFISIISPYKNEKYGLIAPNFAVSIDEEYLFETWYFLSDNQTTSEKVYYEYLEEFTISQNVWDIMNNSYINITFCAKDYYGHVVNESIQVFKDIIAPNITMSTSNGETVFSFNPPFILLNSLDQDIQNISYYFADGLKNSQIFSCNPNELFQLSQTAWNLMNEGAILLEVNVTDDVNNLKSYSFILEKDVSSPEVYIHAPIEGEIIGQDPPLLNYEFEDAHLNRKWYVLVQGELSLMRFLELEQEFSINIDDWNQIQNGSVVLYIYANDTAGNEGMNSVLLEKDTIIPIITILSPLEYSIFENPPIFNISISKDNISNIWYHLYDGVINTPPIYLGEGEIGYIDQITWNLMKDGEIMLIFHANDTLGNEGFKSILIYKDSQHPLITLLKPIENEFFNSTPFSFELVLEEPFIDCTWYVLVNETNPSQYKMAFFEPNGLITIPGGYWNLFCDGNILFQVHANDSIGHQSQVQIRITKDTIAPYIEIIAPQPEDLFETIPPAFEISYYDYNLESVWYSLSQNRQQWTDPEFFTESTGNIQQNIWDQMNSGTVYIRFSINDSAGNIKTTEVETTKDILDPIVYIESPQSFQVFAEAPSFSIRVIESNILEIWYRVNNNPNYYYILQNTSISPTLWDYYANGEIKIDFYVRDKLDHIGHDSVRIIKDTLKPNIYLSGFSENNLYSHDPPIINVYIDDLNPNLTFYSINQDNIWSENIYFEGNDLNIDPSLWEEYSNGTILLRVYAEDKAGNLENKDIVLWKDIMAPEIIIHYPNSNTLSGIIPPNFNVSIIDNQFSESYYFLMDIKNPIIQSNNISFIPSLNHLIDETVWQQFGNGTIYLEFHANDSLGNSNFISIILYKDIIAPQINILEPNNLQLYGSESPIMLIDITDNNYLDAEYWIDDEITTTSPKLFPRNQQTPINSQDWELMMNGTVTLYIKTKDKMNNTNLISIRILKDIIGPQIQIISPIKNELFAHDSPLFQASISDSNFKECWYKISDGNLSTEWIAFLPEISFNFPEWPAFTNGTILITIKANDTMGNINTKTIIVHKDIIPPQLYIETPYNDMYCGINPPSLIMSINESNLQEISYLLQDGTLQVNGSLSLENMIESNDQWKLEEEVQRDHWNLFGNGTLQLTIVAKDIMNNEVHFDFFLRKELSIPNLTIIYPNIQTLYGMQAPHFELYIEGKILDSYWYVLSDSQKTVESPHFKNFTQLEEEIIFNLWNQFGNSTIELIFFAQNEACNVVNKSITIRKDNVIPLIEIMEPINEEERVQKFGKDAPKYNITVDDWNIDKVWYTLSGYNKNFYISVEEFVGSIDQDAWNSYDNATIEITFHASDTAGNSHETSIIIEKEIFASSFSKEKEEDNKEEEEDSEINMEDENLSNNYTQEAIIALPFALSLIIGPSMVIGASFFIRKRYLIEFQ